MMDVKKILVVEDNPVISKWIVHALKAMGYIPLGPAEDASSALEMVRNLSPDLVLMDIKLKGPENGIETSCAIKAITDIPLIYTTSSEDSETIEKATGTNPSAYLLKPLQHKQLKASIEMALYSYEINKVLNREQSLINAFFDQSPAGIIITDSKLNIVKYNAAFANMADLDSFTQTPLYQLFDGIIAGDFLKNDNYRMECCLTGRPEYIIELVSRVINDKTTGRPLLCIINATDITSRKLYEQKMSEMNEVLEKRVSERTRELVNYISGLDDFSYSVSHDINVPLRYVEGLSSIIINEHASSLDPLILDYLKRINNASRRISGLIDEMKSLSEITRA